jgi:hypothetical protein
MGKNKKGSLTNVSPIQDTVILENELKAVEKLLDSGSNISSELDTVVTPTENAVEVSPTENVVEVSPTENAVEVTLTENAGEVLLTENVGEVLLTENAGEVLLTENVGEVTVTENAGEVTATENAGEVKTENALIEIGINSVENNDDVQVDSVNKSCNRRLCSML